MIRGGQRWELEPVAQGLYQFYNSILETARGLSQRYGHEGLSELASLDAGRLQERAHAAIGAVDDETLLGWGRDGADRVVVVGGLLAREFGIRVTIVDPDGRATTKGESSTTAPELVVFRDPQANHFWATQPSGAELHIERRLEADTSVVPPRVPTPEAGQVGEPASGMAETQRPVRTYDDPLSDDIYGSKPEPEADATAAVSDHESRPAGMQPLAATVEPSTMDSPMPAIAVEAVGPAGQSHGYGDRTSTVAPGVLPSQPEPQQSLRPQAGLMARYAEVERQLREYVASVPRRASERSWRWTCIRLASTMGPMKRSSALSVSLGTAHEVPA